MIWSSDAWGFHAVTFLLFLSCNYQIWDKLFKRNGAFPGFCLGKQTFFFFFCVFPIKCCYSCTNKKCTGEYYISETFLFSYTLISSCNCHTLPSQFTVMLAALINVYIILLKLYVLYQSSSFHVIFQNTNKKSLVTWKQYVGNMYNRQLSCWIDVCVTFIHD